MTNESALSAGQAAFVAERPGSWTGMSTEYGAVFVYYVSGHRLERFLVSTRGSVLERVGFEAGEADHEQARQALAALDPQVQDLKALFEAPTFDGPRP